MNAVYCVQLHFNYMYNFKKKNIWRIFNEIVLRSVPQDLVDDNSTLVQVMPFCFQAPNPLPEPMLAKISDAIWCH